MPPAFYALYLYISIYYCIYILYISSEIRVLLRTIYNVFIEFMRIFDLHHKAQSQAH